MFNPKNKVYAQVNPRLLHKLLLCTLFAVLSACVTIPKEKDQAAAVSEESRETEASADVAESPIERADIDTPVTPLARDEELSLGPDDAQVQIFVYLDVACPYSKDAWDSIAAIVNENSPHVRAAVRHFIVKSGSDTAQAHLEAAARLDSGKAVALLGSLFDDPPSGIGFLFGNRSADQIVADHIGRAQLDPQAIKSAIDEGQLHHVVTRDTEEARRLGFTGTPGMVINGVRVRGALSKENYQLLVDAFMSSSEQEARNQ